MNCCGYAYDDDFYNSVSCALPEGHEGPHRASFEWETRVEDICRVRGCDWGAWEPLPPKPNGTPWVFPPTTIKNPTAQRHCMRCGRRGTNGEYPARPVYPVVRITDLMPRVKS